MKGLAFTKELITIFIGKFEFMDKSKKALEIITDIFRRELGDNSLNIEFSTSADDIEMWDSINNLVLISAIEEAFNITFPIDVIFEAKNVGDLCDFVVKNSDRI